MVVLEKSRQELLLEKGDLQAARSRVAQLLQGREQDLRTRRDHLRSGAAYGKLDDLSHLALIYAGFLPFVGRLVVPKGPSKFVILGKDIEKVRQERVEVRREYDRRVSQNADSVRGVEAEYRQALEDWVVQNRMRVIFYAIENRERKAAIFDRYIQVVQPNLRKSVLESLEKEFMRLTGEDITQSRGVIRPLFPEPVSIANARRRSERAKQREEAASHSEVAKEVASVGVLERIEDTRGLKYVVREIAEDAINAFVSGRANKIAKNDPRVLEDCRRMVAYIRQNPTKASNPGLEKMRGTRMQIDWNMYDLWCFHPNKLSGWSFDHPESRRIRIVYALYGNGKNILVFDRDGIYTHDQFDSQYRRQSR